MRKKNYKQISLKRANWTSIKEKTANKKLIFGVDVGKKLFVGALLTEDREVISTLKWSHPKETRELIDRFPWGYSTFRQ